jgi:predicted HTH transcriptional regulator
VEARCGFRQNNACSFDISLKNSWQAAKGMGRVDLNAIESASSETARHINREIVLQLIHARQPISRADLARVSGLQRSTVSQIIEQLIRERWIREGAVAQLPRGNGGGEP